jgi:hypothetical protein
MGNGLDMASLEVPPVSTFHDLFTKARYIKTNGSYMNLKRFEPPNGPDDPPVEQAPFIGYALRCDDGSEVTFRAAELKGQLFIKSVSVRKPC